MMEFSEKIRFARAKLEMSQEELAQALNVSYASIHRWENAKTKPNKMVRAVFDSFCGNHGISFTDNEGDKRK